MFYPRKHKWFGWGPMSPQMRVILPPISAQNGHRCAPERERRREGNKEGRYSWRREVTCPSCKENRKYCNSLLFFWIVMLCCNWKWCSPPDWIFQIFSPNICSTVLLQKWSSSCVHKHCKKSTLQYHLQLVKSGNCPTVCFYFILFYFFNSDAWYMLAVI